MQTDAIGDGMNMYAYGGGDPVNLTDPSGLCGGRATRIPCLTTDASPSGNGVGYGGGFGGGGGGDMPNSPGLWQWLVSTFAGGVQFASDWKRVGDGGFVGYSSSGGRSGMGSVGQAAAQEDYEIVEAGLGSAVKWLASKLKPKASPPRFVPAPKIGNRRFTIPKYRHPSTANCDSFRMEGASWCTQLALFQRLLEIR